MWSQCASLILFIWECRASFPSSLANLQVDSQNHPAGCLFESGRPILGPTKHLKMSENAMSWSYPILGQDPDWNANELVKSCIVEIGSWIRDFQFYSDEGSDPFPRGYISEISKLHKILKSKKTESVPTKIDKVKERKRAHKT